MSHNVQKFEAGRHIHGVHTRNLVVESIDDILVIIRHVSKRSREIVRLYQRYLFQERNVTA